MSHWRAVRAIKARGAGKVGWEEVGDGFRAGEGKTPGLRDGLGSGCGRKDSERTPVVLTQAF